MNRSRLLATAFVASSLFGAARAGATPISGPHSVSAFYSNDDGFLHAIVAQTSGDVQEVYYVNGSVHSDVLAQFASPVTAVGSFYSVSDALRHVIVGLQNGQVWEVYFNPQVGITRTLLRTEYFPIISVTAWSDAFGAEWYSTLDSGGGAVMSTIFQLQNHAPVFFQTYGYATTPTPLGDAAGVGMPYSEGPGASPADIFISLGMQDVRFSTAIVSWRPGPSQVTFGGELYPLADLPISFAAVPNFVGDTPFADVLALDASNHLLELGADRSLGPSVAWTFLYGPNAISLGATIDPVNNVKHVPVMMSNGDLWDMHAPTPFGSAWTFQYLGRY
jgi:hypothetical protein